MKEKVKRLWSLCFDDSEEFIDLYFEKRYKEEINIAVWEGDEVIAALQMIPYPMTFVDSVIATSYISGACTHPDYRSQGVMKSLLKNALSKTYQEGKLLSTLIPAEGWLFDYYNRFGYEAVFDYSTEAHILKTIAIPTDYYVVEDVADIKTIYTFFNREMMKRSCCVQHSREDFDLILADLKLSGGKLFIIKDTQQIVGLAFCLFEDGVTVIKEFLQIRPDVNKVLENHLLKTTNVTSIKYILPLDQGDNRQPLGMARVVNAEKLLSLYARQNEKLKLGLFVNDPILPYNDGYYRITEGICHKAQVPIKETTYTCLTINQLTAFLMEYNIDSSSKELYASDMHFPYMSLMLN